MEASRRLRATRIPLLPRQVKTYFGLSQGDDIDGKEEGYGSDCAAEEEDASDLEETVPPSFRINLPNSPFCSATNGSNNISGLLVESARKSMEQLSQPKLSISLHKFQSSQQTSRTDDSRTITLAQQSNQLDPTSDIEHRQSFRINIPNSPFCSTYGTSMLESRPSIAQSSQNSIGGCSDVEIQNRTTATLKSTSEVPSFHFNIPNSPFNSTYNTTIATTMEPSVQPSVNVNYKETQESKPSDDVNSSNLNSEATTEKTQNRTSLISMMESSFHFNIPNSPFNSTCSTPNATKSSIISSQPSVNVSYKKAQGRPDRLQSAERFEIEKQYHQLASQQPPSALNDKQTGKRADKWWLTSDRRASQSGSMFSAMNGLRISGTFGGAGGDTEMNRKSLPVFHRFSTQLKSPFLRFPPLIESDKPEVVCAEDVESSVLKSVRCSSETTSNGVNIECLNFHEAVKSPALKNDFGATSNCERIVRNSSEKMDSVGTMEVNLSSIQHDPIVLCDDDKRVSLSNDGEKSSKEIMASSELTSLAESAVPYLRPHSPLSMGDAVRQNESLKQIRLPSPIRFMRAVPTLPKSTRPIVPRPSKKMNGMMRKN